MYTATFVARLNGPFAVMMQENSEPSGGMRVGGQSVAQQPLPSVSQVMGPPQGQYRNPTSYASPQSSQPTTPVHSVNMAPSPIAPSSTSGPVRMVALPSQISSPMSAPVPTLQAPASVAYFRSPDPTQVQANPQMQVISPPQYVAVEAANIQPVTNGVAQGAQGEQQTPKQRYRLLKDRFRFLVYVSFYSLHC